MTEINIKLNSDSVVTISKDSNSESTYTGVLGKEDLKEVIGLFIDDFIENNDI